MQPNKKLVLLNLFRKLRDFAHFFLCSFHFLNIFASLFSAALVVRFLTRRFIWEYDPTLGKTNMFSLKTSAFTAAGLTCFHGKLENNHRTCSNNSLALVHTFET